MTILIIKKKRRGGAPKAAPVEICDNCLRRCRNGAPGKCSHFLSKFVSEGENY